MATRNRALPQDLLVQSSTASSVRPAIIHDEVVRAMNSNSNSEDEESQDEQDNDTFRESSLDGITSAIPHLWADMVVNTGTTSTTTIPRQGIEQAGAGSTSGLNNQHSHRREHMQPSTVMSSCGNGSVVAAPHHLSSLRSSNIGAGGSPSPSHSNDINPNTNINTNRCNSSCSTTSSTLDSTTHNRFSTVSSSETAATSEGCHHAHSGHNGHNGAASKHNSLNGMMEIAKRYSGVSVAEEDQEEEGNGEGDETVIPEPEAGDEDDMRKASVEDKSSSLDGAKQESSMPSSASSPMISTSSRLSMSSSNPASSSDMTSSSSRDDGYTGLSAVVSTVSVASSPSTARSQQHQQQVAFPKRSFLSNVFLSRSTSLSGQHRNSNDSFARTRTTSTSRGSANHTITAARASDMPTGSNNHARHVSNPHTPTTGPSSSSFTSTSTLPTSLPQRAEERRARTSTSSQQAQQQGAIVPPPFDSVFSTASRPYIHELDTQTRQSPSERAGSPVSSLTSASNGGTAGTPSSRAARYLSRHFNGAASSPSHTVRGDEGRVDDASSEILRRSPTPTRFFGGGGATSTAGTSRSASMPMLSSLSVNNNSSNSLPAGSSASGTTMKSTSSKSNLKGKDKETSSSASSAAVAPLSTFNLSLNPLTPQISLSKLGQPLCGAVLDEKYLLIGTSLGLDFIPLHREGNRSLKGGLFGSSLFASSSSSAANADSNGYGGANASGSQGGSNNNGITDENLDKKVRKPIPLVKKTRFKQLVILSERSNVLLAIAGRNDHVRVYALDTLRKLIEKKMKEIDAVNPPNLPSLQQRQQRMPGNKGLGLSLRKEQPPVPTLPGDLKGKGRALPSLGPISTGRAQQNGHSSSSNLNTVSQYSPPPAYEHTSTSTSEHSMPHSAGSGGFPSSSSSASTHRNRGSQPLREHVAGSSRALRRGAKSCETLRRGSGSSTTHGNSSGSSSRSAPSNSRRGSSATVMPDSPFAAATGVPMPSGGIGRRRASVATVVPTSPTNETLASSIQSTITRRGSTAQLADMGQVTSEQHISRSLLPGEELDDESYEWVDAPEDENSPFPSSSGYSFPPHPAAPRRDYVPAVPPLPEQYANASSSSAHADATSRSRSTSATTSSSYRPRMTPRSARIRSVETQSEEEEQEEIDIEDNASVYATPYLSQSDIVEAGPADGQSRHTTSRKASTSFSVGASGPRPTSSTPQDEQRRNLQIKKNRRVSLAEILNESRADPFQADDVPPLPTSTTRNAFTDPLPSTSRFPSVQQPITPRRLQARSAVAKSTHGALSDLADFLNEGPPAPVVASSSASTSTSTSAFSRPSAFLRRTLTSTSIPEMQQLQRAESPVTTPMLNSRSPSLSSFSSAVRTPKFTPRDAQVPKKDQEEMAGRDSLLELLRDGPPEEATGMAPMPITPRRPSQSRRLQKGQHNSSISLQSNVSTATAPISSHGRTSSSQQSREAGGRPSIDTQDNRVPRPRTRSDGAAMHRNGNYILSADEIVPVPVTVTTPAPTDSFANKTRKRRSLQPRSPNVRQFIAEFEPQTSEDGSEMAQAMSRGLSLQEMLAASGADDTNSPVLGSEDDTAAPARNAERLSAASNTSEGQSQMGNRRNRWSLLVGMRSTPTAPDMAPSTSSGRRSRDSIASALEAVNTATAAVALSSTEAAATSAATETVTGISGPPPMLKPSRRNALLDDESPPFGNLTPDMQQQIADGASDPDGTTIMFTQQTTRARGELTSTASVVTNGANASSTSTNARNNLASKTNSAAMQKDPISGNLEYVKLARTKGSRFLRASETGKRTYLAVLCGEAGERIELFTGAKNVSLSLNRTFVLPETPRTIEFQLQGEDLLDLYLIYDSAIFALEPSTVRVREVGIQRNERRQARRERDRMQRQTETLEGVDGSIPPPSPDLPNARPERVRETSRTSEGEDRDGEAGDAVAAPAPVTGTVAIPSTPEPASTPTPRAASISEVASAEQPEVGAVSSTEAVETVTATVSSVVSTNTSLAAAPAIAERSDTPVSTTPYTTFQQLEYLPQIPPSVLASSYIIPPTYEAVLSASPNPESNNNAMFSNKHFTYAGGTPSLSTASSSSATLNGSSPEISRSATPIESLSRFNSPWSTHLAPDWRSPSSLQLQPQTQQNQQNGLTPSPLLSPVSLLANPSAKNIGPPGLFFVTKGRTSTGIVDGDGRSVIRQPISWLTSTEEAADLPESYEGLNHFSRLEVILSSPDKTRVCIAAFGPTSVRTVELGHPDYTHSIEVIPYEALKRQTKSLATVKNLKNQGKEVADELVFVRDITYLAKAGQCTFFAERVGSNIGIYSLGMTGYTFH